MRGRQHRGLVREGGGGGGGSFETKQQQQQSHTHTYACTRALRKVFTYQGRAGRRGRRRAWRRARRRRPVPAGATDAVGTAEGGDCGVGGGQGKGDR